MKTLPGVCLVILCSASSGPPPASSPARSVAPPLACDPASLDAAQRQRRQVLVARLRAVVQEIRELPAGYAFQFPAETSCILELADWMSLERLCCPFLDFELQLGAGQASLWLRVTGRDGVKEFLQAELELPAARDTLRSRE